MPSTTITPKVVIFTDLDGCLLDRETYSFDPAQPALHLIRERKIPLIFVSSKTRAEIEGYRKKLKNTHPFVSENGGAVFIPRTTFSFTFSHGRELEGYFVLELGTFYPQILRALEFIKKESGVRIRAFHELSIKELASLSGLTREEAALAKKREYDEPFVIEGGAEEIKTIQKKIKERGLHYVWGGRFHHILGKNDKGKAVKMLKGFYVKEFEKILTVGIGDSLNDLPMLNAVDHPILLKGKEEFSPGILSQIGNLTVAAGTGPQAWNEAILRILRP